MGFYVKSLTRSDHGLKFIKLFWKKNFSKATFQNKQLCFHSKNSFLIGKYSKIDTYLFPDLVTRVNFPAIDGQSNISCGNWHAWPDQEKDKDEF